MSRALASARARRANISTSDPVSVSSQRSNTMENQPAPAGLTLPQVIALVDSRLVTLEKFMKDTQEQPPRAIRFEDQSAIDGTTQGELDQDEFETPIVEVLEDFNNRFSVLANEIAELKDIVIKLQSYTMDVNKTLMNDRVRILSDLGQGEDSLFIMKGVSEDIPTDILTDASNTDNSESNIRFSFSETA